MKVSFIYDSSLKHAYNISPVTPQSSTTTPETMMMSLMMPPDA